MYEELLEQLKKAREDPIFQQMEKAAQGVKQSEKTVNTQVRGNKKQKTQDRRKSSILGIKAQCAIPCISGTTMS